MARLTWQNVTAPSFDDAIRAQGLATYGITEAFKGLGDVAAGAQSRREDAANAAAFNKMLTHQDVGSWDQALANGGLEALGISPDMASDALLNAMTGHQTGLRSKRSTDFTHADNVYQFDRRQTLDGREDLSYQEGRDEKARNEAALERAFGIAGSALSREDGMFSIIDSPLGAKDKQATLDAFGPLSDGFWALPSDAAVADPTTAKSITAADEMLTDQERNIKYRQGVERHSRIGVLADELSQSTTDPFVTMINELGINHEVLDEEGNPTSNHNWNTAETKELADGYAKQFKDVPRSLIAAVMKEGITGKTWKADFNDGFRYTFDKDFIEETLTQYSDPSEIQAIRSEADQYRRATERTTQARQKIGDLQNELLLLQRRGASPDVIAAKQLEIQAVVNGVINMPAVSAIPR